MEPVTPIQLYGTDIEWASKLYIDETGRVVEPRVFAQGIGGIFEAVAYPSVGELQRRHHALFFELVKYRKKGLDGSHILLAIEKLRCLYKTESEEYYDWYSTEIQAIERRFKITGDKEERKQFRRALNLVLSPSERRREDARRVTRFTDLPQTQTEPSLVAYIPVAEGQCANSQDPAIQSSLSQTHDQDNVGAWKVQPIEEDQQETAILNSPCSVPSPPQSQSAATSSAQGSPQSTLRYPDLSAFKPSRCLINEERNVSLDRLNRAREVRLDLRGSYRGEISDFDIRNETVPTGLNCAVRIEKIDPEATLKEIFGIFRHKIFQFSLNNPIPGKHNTSAARVVFMDRDAAEEFLDHASSHEGIYVHKKRIWAFWNRDHCGPADESVRRQSRVLRVSGPPDQISTVFLLGLFKDKIKYNLVDSREWTARDGKKIVELSFASILGQSRLALKYFKEFLKVNDMFDRSNIWYARDPCDRSNEPPTCGGGSGVASLSWRHGRT